jgi:hypothetical protein
VIVKEEGTEAYLNYLSQFFPLLVVNDWNQAAQLIYTLKAQPEKYEQYRAQLLMSWQKLKADVKGWIKQVYAL